MSSTANVDELVVAVYQGRSCPLGSAERNLQVALDQAAQAAAQGAKLLLFPELFLSGYDLPRERLHAAGIDLSEPSPAIASLREAARRHKIALCVPYVERVAASQPLDPSARRFRARGAESGDDAFQFFNASLLIDESGEIVLNYRKVHLWCAGQYGFEADVFDAGGSEQLRAVMLQPWGVRVGILICYDIEFPEAARSLFLQGVELLLVPTALAEGCPAIPRCVVPCRAMENHCFVMYSNFPSADAPAGMIGAMDKPITFCGLSCIVDAHGVDVARATGPFQGLLLAPLSLRSREGIADRNPYLLHRRPDVYQNEEQKKSVG